MKKTTVLFAGTGTFAVPVLEALHQNFNVKLVITQPPRPQGKKKELKPSPVALAAEKLNLPIETPQKIRELESKLEDIAADVSVVTDYGQIVPQTILDIPTQGTLNVHPSLLPRWRGPSPIETAILNNDKETGVTIMLLDAKMDHGPILAQETRKLNGTETAVELYEELSQTGAKLLVDTLPRYLSGELKPQEQNHTRAIYCEKLTRESGRIDFSKPADVALRQLRALTPWPGLWFDAKLNQKTSRIKIYAAKIKKEGSVISSTPIGSLFCDNKNLGLSMENGQLLITELQVEGKKTMNARDFCAGYGSSLEQN